MIKTKKKTVTKEEFEKDIAGNMVSKTTTTIEEYEESFLDDNKEQTKDTKTTT